MKTAVKVLTYLIKMIIKDKENIVT